MGRHNDREPARGRDDYGDYGDYGGYRSDPPARSAYESSGYSSGYDNARDRRDRRYDDVYDDYDFGSSRHEPTARAKAPVGTASVEVVQQERMSKMEAAYERRGGTRRAGAGKRRAGAKDDEQVDKAKLLKKRKRKRRWIALACVVVMLTGVGIVGGTIFFQSVVLPGDIPMPQTNIVNFADGKTEMARLGSAYREKVDMATLPAHVKYAVIAAEDQTFYQNPGVDFKGVMRAFWNNITGGETQGASTITQQYAGLAADMRDQATYGRKAQEAVIAMKLDDKYSKEEILGFYLDLVPFGRTAEGIGAAAKAFYGKDAKDLTVPEAALLAGQIKSPNGSFDPQDPLGIENEAQVLERYNYVLDSMVAIGQLDAAERATMTEPPKTLENTSNPANVGEDEDTGFVSHHRVYEELEANYGITKEQLQKEGGYTITTTIDQRIQKAAHDAASTKGSILKGQPKNLRAALVAVDPTTGEVKAYYGGSDDGSKSDKAGPENPHQPGSSFKVFTMLTALSGTSTMGGASIDSLWDSRSPKQFDDRKSKVTNSENDNSCGKDCKLIDAIRHSLNVPTYSMTKTFGAENVVATARDLGITHMTGGGENSCEYENVDLVNTPIEDYHNCFDNEVGFGQYQVSVEDMAAAFATLANKGERIPAHFIKSVTKDGEELKPTIDFTPKQVIDRNVATDAIHVMKTIHPSESGKDGTLANGSQFAGKTGTWERYCKEGCDENSQNWYVGLIPQLAAASWLGDATEENGSIKDKNGQAQYGSQISGSIWLKFMNKALKYLDNKDPVTFDPATHTGSPTNGDHAAPAAPPPTTAPPTTTEPTPPTEPTDTPTTEPGSTPTTEPTKCPVLEPNCKGNN